MDMTPEAVRAVEFRWKKTRGYDGSDVDEFVEEMAVGLAALVEQLAAVQDRLSRAEHESINLRTSEDSMRRALVHAQRTADEIIAATRAEADQRMAEAESQRVAMLADAEHQRRAVLAEAERSRQALLAEAATQARRSQSDIDRGARAEVDRLYDVRNQLQADIDVLRQHLVAERRRARTALHSALQALERSPGPIPAPAVHDVDPITGPQAAVALPPDPEKESPPNRAPRTDPTDAPAVPGVPADSVVSSDPSVAGVAGLAGAPGEAGPVAAAGTSAAAVHPGTGRTASNVDDAGAAGPSAARAGGPAYGGPAGMQGAEDEFLSVLTGEPPQEPVEPDPPPTFSDSLLERPAMSQWSGTAGTPLRSENLTPTGPPGAPEESVTLGTSEPSGESVTTRPQETSNSTQTPKDTSLLGGPQTREETPTSGGWEKPQAGEPVESPFDPARVSPTGQAPRPSLFPPIGDAGVAESAPTGPTGTTQSDPASTWTVAGARDTGSPFGPLTAVSPGLDWIDEPEPDLDGPPVASNPRFGARPAARSEAEGAAGQPSTLYRPFAFEGADVPAPSQTGLPPVEILGGELAEPQIQPAPWSEWSGVAEGSTDRADSSLTARDSSRQDARSITAAQQDDPHGAIDDWIGVGPFDAAAEDPGGAAPVASDPAGAVDADHAKDARSDAGDDANEVDGWSDEAYMDELRQAAASTDPLGPGDAGETPADGRGSPPFDPDATSPARRGRRRRRR